MKNKVFIFSHVHWDREWYKTYQEFRFDLIKVIDNILYLLEKDEYKYFVLDGQTIVIEDYLEIKPKQINILKKLIKANKLLIGPWYILPDEFLVSGEAIIRNLLLGIKISKKLGANPKIGYLPDMFGHISQMPQILKNFNLNYSILWRGLKPKKSLFYWEGLDKSKIISLHLTEGYYNTIIINYENQKKDLKDYLGKLRNYSNENILFPSGGDHLGAVNNLKEILDDISNNNKEYSFYESNIIDFFEEVKENNINEIISGELKYPSSSYILSGVYSSRIYLKQENFKLQNLITNIVEPISTIAWLNGDTYKEEFINTVWKKLLQNQPHDSICGCSTDQVHREMIIRYDEGNQISNKIIKSSIEYIESLFNLDKNNDYFILYNLTNWNYEGVIKFNFDTINLDLENISILDEENNELSFEILNSYHTRKFVSEIDVLPDWINIKRFEIILKIDKFNPLSYKLLKVIEKKENILKYKSIFDIGKNYISNSFIKIYIENNDVFLEYNNRKYIINRFIVTGDAGDEYNYSPPINDYLYKAKIENYEIVENNYFSCTLKVNYLLELPEKLEIDRKSYTNKTVINKIETFININYDYKRIYFKTNINNNAEDFRLRVYFSQDIINKEENIIYYDTAFGILSKELKENLNPIDVNKGEERREETIAVQNYASLFSNNNGLGIFTKGLPEFEIYKEDNIFYLSSTIIRAVGWLSRDDLRTRGGGAGPSFETPEAQCKGLNSFEYCIDLFDDNFYNSNLNKVALQYSNSILINQFKSKSNMDNIPVNSILNIYPENIVLSSLKKSENYEKSFIIRFYNPTNIEIDYNILLEKRLNIKKVFLVNMNEERIRKMPIYNNSFISKIKSFEIITIEINLV